MWGEEVVGIAMRLERLLSVLYSTGHSFTVCLSPMIHLRLSQRVVGAIFVAFIWVARCWEIILLAQVSHISAVLCQRHR